MCGRYLLTSPPEAVADMFGVDVRSNFPPRWNIAPTQPIATIRLDAAGAASFALVRWGFIPSWAKADWFARMGSKPLINARSETAGVKPTFRAAFRRRRCLAPADGFYEWQAGAEGKQPWCIQPAAGGLVAFAALWETAYDPDGGEIDTAAILTVSAGTDVAPLHNREPAVIAQADFANWLGGDERDAAGKAAMLRCADPGFWRAHKVSRAVNNARNEGEALARALDEGTLL